MPFERHDQTRIPLLTLTITKLLTNAALRLAYPFLGDISRGLHLSKTEGGRLLGLAELAGLGSIGVGRQLDRGRHRRWFTAGVLFGATGALLFAFVRTPWSLGVGFGFVSLGVGITASAGHSFLGDQVPFARRARAIGLYESSWAVALLIGGPLFAFAIRTWSWWTPFACVGVLLLLGASVVYRRLPHTTVRGDHHEILGEVPDTRVVTLTIVSSVCLTLASVMTFATFGPWLEARHSMRTGGLGFVAMALGCTELLGTSLVSGFGDRIGARRAVVLGVCVMTVGSGVLVLVGNTGRLAAIAGVIVFFGGFEFGFVALLSVVSEVGRSSRGTVVAIDHALVVLARAVGAVIGPLAVGESSGRFGSVQVAISGLAVLSGIAISLAGRFEMH